MSRKKVIISIIVIILIAVIILSLYIVYKEKHIEAEGDFTGYQLELVVSYEGHGYSGKDLGSGSYKEIYNISQGDILYEDYFRGLSIYNKDEVDTEASLGSFTDILLEIVKLEDNKVTIKDNTNTYDLQYDQESNLPSNFSVDDATNFSYVIKIVKVNNRILQNLRNF